MRDAPAERGAASGTPPSSWTAPLLWLHELDVIRLNNGLVVFRPAMTIRLEQRDRRGFTRADLDPLELHYKGQVLQIHVMVEFPERSLAAMSEALRLTMDYFTLREEAFVARWLPGRDKEIGRETTPEPWWKIVDSLGEIPSNSASPQMTGSRPRS